MSDPRRLFETDDGATRAMIEAAMADGPSPRATRGAAAALGLGSLAVAGTAAAAGTTGVVSAGGAATGGAISGGAGLGGAGLASTAIVGKWLSIVAPIVIVGATSGGVAYVASRPEPPRVVAAAPRNFDAPPSAAASPAPRPATATATATATSTSTSTSTSTPTSTSTSTPTPTPTPTPGRAPTVLSSSALTAETAALDRARAALRADDAPEALAALDDYARRYPAGVLAPESTVLRVEALVRAGDRASAERLADRFLRDHPESPLTERVRHLVGRVSNP